MSRASPEPNPDLTGRRRQTRGTPVNVESGGGCGVAGSRRDFPEPPAATAPRRRIAGVARNCAGLALSPSSGPRGSPIRAFSVRESLQRSGTCPRCRAGNSAPCPPVDSRFRGNDATGPGGVIPARAGSHSNQNRIDLGTNVISAHAGIHGSRGGSGTSIQAGRRAPGPRLDRARSGKAVTYARARWRRLPTARAPIGPLHRVNSRR